MKAPVAVLVCLTLSLASVVIMNVNKIGVQKSPEDLDTVPISVVLENHKKEQTLETAAEFERF